MIFFILLMLASTSVLIFLFFRHLGEIKALSAEELEKKIAEELSPFHEIEEKIFYPTKIWLGRHLPLAILKTGEVAVKETRHILLRLAGSLGGVHDYLRGRKISLNIGRKSAYWTEIHGDIKNGGSDNKKTPE